MAQSLPKSAPMADDNPSTSFPKTSQDINNLKQTAATVKDQVKDLGSHAVFETQDQLAKAKDSLSDLVNSAKTYARERPLVCMGLAFGLGLIIGKAHHLCYKNEN